MAGIKDQEMRKKLFRVKEDDFSLENIVSICTTEENARRNEQIMSSKHLNYLNRKSNVFQRRRSKSRQRRPAQKYGTAKCVELSGTYGSTNQKCSNCAKSHPPNKCGAIGRKYNGCNKLEHFFEFAQTTREVELISSKRKIPQVFM